MLEQDYILLIKLVLTIVILYGISSYIGDMIDSRDRRKRLERKLKANKDKYKCEGR